MTITENSTTNLTGRERQIARLVCQGLSNKAIGRLPNITDGTIKVHLHNIFQKLEISSRTVLAIFVQRSLWSPESLTEKGAEGGEPRAIVEARGMRKPSPKRSVGSSAK